MKKIFLLLGLTTSLLFAEHRAIKGEILSTTLIDDETIRIIVKNYDNESIQAETKNITIKRNDKVKGECYKYEGSTWKLCSIIKEN